MKRTQRFASIELPDNRVLMIREFMPAELLGRLLEQSQAQSFSPADHEEYAAFGVTITTRSNLKARR